MAYKVNILCLKLQEPELLFEMIVFSRKKREMKWKKYIAY